MAPAIMDPEIKVRNLDRPDEFTNWHISQNLTDRWGEVNVFDAQNKPLDELQNRPGHLARLQRQMVDEITFIVRKDGKFGILFEMEYGSKESETDADANDVSDYLPHAELLADLVKTVRKLQEEFPMVEWAIPSEDQICNDRLVVWGFFPDGTLTEEERTDVATALYDIENCRM